MRTWNRSLIAALSLSLIVVVGTAAPAAAAQFGVGLNYLHTLEDLGDVDSTNDFSQDDFSIFGSVTVPVALVRIEGDLEWVPGYLGGDSDLWQPQVYAFLPLGLLYGGIGMGIGHLDGNWASNPFYALRAGIEFGLGGLAADAFLTYRLQSANFGEASENLDLDALILGAQVKFGG